MGGHTLPQIVSSVVSTPFLNANTAKPKIIDDGTVIKKGTVISPERSRALLNAVVIIRGGRIAEIGTNLVADTQANQKVVVQKIEPERLLSMAWYRYAVDPEKDYSNGPLLAVTESGFSKLPADRPDEALRMNEGGWSEQLKNIERHVAPA